MSLIRRRSLGVLAAVAVLVGACGGGASPTPAPASQAPSAAPASATPAASAAPAEQTLTYAIDGEITLLSNGLNDVPTGYASAWLHAQLYRYDASLTPVPDLAAKLADITEGGKVWTLTLRDGLKFSDGSPLTSADVVQTYEIARSPNCRYNPSVCLSSVLDKVEAVDPVTIKFTLKDPAVTFGTLYLPGIYIESKAAIDASYAKFKEGTSKVTAAESKAVIDKLDAIDKATPADGTPDYSPLTADMEALLAKAGIALPDKAAYTDDKGVLDAAGYANELATGVRALDAQFTAPAIDALAAAYPYLSYGTNPVGAGPFKLDQFKPGESLTYSRNENYWAGLPQISKMFIPIIKDDIAGGQALKAGQIDWKYSLEGTTYEEIKDAPNLKFDEYPDFGFFALYFNLRSGQLFADKNLRQAVAWCVDKPATVAAATSNQGVAVYSEIPPASWAYPTDLQKYEPRDVAKAKSLIEASGWKLGADGIYEKDGKKLSTVVAVRAERPNRSKFMQLLSDQVKECGMDIKYKEVDFASLLNMLDNFPHVNAADPASKRPFDAYFGGFSTGYDPDPFSLYHSSQCTTKEQPALYNYICYQNPEVDKLIEAGLKEFDQAKRATIYHDYAKLQAEDLPVFYAWSDIARQGLAKTVNSTAGDLPLDTPTFYWEPEKLTNIK